MKLVLMAFLGLAILVVPSIRSITASADDKKILADLDIEYQLAVKNNDAKTMDRILHDEFALVLGDGRTFNKADLLKLARDKTIVWERQEDSQQSVRIWGDTATVTALLWEKGSRGGKTVEKKLWFTDVYIKTPKGWRYVFGQASLPLPD
jgi:ketosteroid isomerase-like protein